MDEELLIRFLTHTCTTEDIKAVDNWIAADKENANWLFEMEKIWSLRNELRFSEKKEIENAYNRFLGSISKESENVKTLNMINVLKIMRYAAVLLVISLITVYFYKIQDNNVNAFNLIEVPKGQHVSLTLSDGTKVILNAESKLTYPSEFSGKERSVELHGEAFFEVTHNKKIPFIVKGSFLNVKVLGTKFNFRSYPNEKAEVTLDEGKVEVESFDFKNKRILSPGQQILYTPKEGMRLINKTDVSLVKSWTTGELSFQNKRLDEICAELERKFNVHINIENKKLTKEVFTCHFKNTVTIDQIFVLLKETRNINYKIKNNEITIF